MTKPVKRLFDSGFRIFTFALNSTCFFLKSGISLYILSRKFALLGFDIYLWLIFLKFAIQDPSYIPENLPKCIFSTEIDYTIGKYLVASSSH